MRTAEELRMAAARAMGRAHAPYSKFPVGAALEDEGGGLHVGANVECVAYPLGSCAETTAIGHMVMTGARRIVQIAVIAERMDRVTPCGGCRQRLAEFGSPDTLVHLCDGSRVVESVRLAELFPHGFTAELA